MNKLLPICSLIFMAILPFALTAKTSQIFLIEVDNSENKNYIVSPSSTSLYSTNFDANTASIDDDFNLDAAASVNLKLLDNNLLTINDAIQNHLHRVKKEILNNVDGTIRYTLGQRQSGDRLVSTNTDSKRWNVPQNVKLSLGYPASGLGALITYIEIIVTQTGNLGNATVISGGIGQRHVTIVVNSLNTLVFSYVSSIYGL